MARQRRGERWTAEEDGALLEAYRAGTPIVRIATNHQRSRPAVFTRLVRLGEIKPEDKSESNVPVTAPTCGWTYLLLSERGEVYLGATPHLRQRVREHNSPDNRGWTRGRKWHLLAARAFENSKEAFALELELKKAPYKKKRWKLQCVARACKIVGRYGYGFSPTGWGKANS